MRKGLPFEALAKEGFAMPLVLMAVAVVIVIAGVFTYFIITPKPVPPGGSSIIVPSPSATSPIQKDETANWKTYENKALGFSIKYPPNAKLTGAIDVGGVGTVDLDLAEINSKITIAVKDRALAEAFPSSFGSCSQKGEVVNVLIGDVEGKRCVRKSADGSTVLIIIDDFTRNGQVIYDMALIKLRPSEQNLEGAKFFDQILSTFKFID